VSKMTFETLSLRDVDAHYYLRPDRIFGVFYLMDTPLQVANSSSTSMSSFNNGMNNSIGTTTSTSGSGSTWNDFFIKNPQARAQIQAEIIKDEAMKQKLNDIDSTMEAFAHQAEAHLESRHFVEKSTPHSTLGDLNDVLLGETEEEGLSFDENRSAKKSSGGFDYYNKMIGGGGGGGSGGGKTNQSKGLRKILSALSQSSDSVKSDGTDGNNRSSTASPSQKPVRDSDGNVEDSNSNDDLRGSFIMYSEQTLRKHNSHPRLRFAKSKSSSKNSSGTSTNSISSSPSASVPRSSTEAVTTMMNGGSSRGGGGSLNTALSFPIYDDRLSVSGYVEMVEPANQTTAFSRPKSQSTPVEMISQSFSKNIGRRFSTSTSTFSPSSIKNMIKRTNTPPLSTREGRTESAASSNSLSMDTRGKAMSYLQDDIDTAEKINLENLDFDFTDTNHDVLL
jgi:hypothetical protein